MPTKIYLEPIKNTVQVGGSGTKLVVLEIAPTVGAVKGLGNAAKYQGAHASDPDKRTDGLPLEVGDYYLNTTYDDLRYYLDTGVFSSPEENAKQSEDNAKASETAAKASEDAAKVSETNADASEAAAKVSETNAKASENAADADRIAAQAAASAAAMSEGNANVSEDNAAASEASAGNFATAAANSAAQAEAAFDNFDDKYLGAKSVDPTTDNDGNPLQVGASYWNIPNEEQRFWSGNSWDVPSEVATQAADRAVAARDDAELAEANAQQSEQNAAISEAAADLDRIAAEAAAAAAASSETNAKASEDAAKLSETNAKASEDAAKASEIEASKALVGSIALSKVAHELQKTMRKRESTGSGFREWGNHFGGSANDTQNINEGMDAVTSFPNKLRMGWSSSSNAGGVSRTPNPIAVVDGVEISVQGTGITNETVLIDFPAAPDATKTLNPTTGEVHKFTSEPGVGEEWDAYTVNFDGNTYVKLPTYNMAVGSKVEFKCKTRAGGVDSVLSDATNALQLRIDGNRHFYWNGLTNVRINGNLEANSTFDVELGVEYHVEAETTIPSSIAVIGARHDGGWLWDGEIWDIKLDDPTQPGTARHYKSLRFAAVGNAPDTAVLLDELENDNEVQSGFSPFYQQDGAVAIPAFPLADNMDISAVIRPDQVASDMVFGDNDPNGYLRWYNYNGGANFQIRVGSDGNFQMTPLLPGDLYYCNIKIRKNPSPATDYTVTVQVNEEIGTQTTVNFATDVFDSFHLGATSPTGGASGWDGAIFDFGISYPDTPDMNRFYSSLEPTDPGAQNFVRNDLGFTDEDWTPAFTDTTNVETNTRVEIPMWLPTGDNYEISGIGYKTGSAYDDMTLGNSNNDAMYGLYVYWDGSSPTMNANWRDTVGSQVTVTLPAPTGDTTFYWKFVRSGTTGTLTVNGKSVTVTDRNDPCVGIDIIGQRGTHRTSSNSWGWNGEIAEVRFVDLDNPANSRHYPLVINSVTQPDTLEAVDEAYTTDAPFYSPVLDGSTGRYMEVSPWNYVSGDKVELKFRWDGTRNKGIIDGDTQDVYMYVGLDGNLVWRDSKISRVLVDGEQVFLYGFFPEIGREYSLEIEFDVSGNIAILGNLYLRSSNAWDGRIWDVSFISNTDPANSRFYPVIEYRPDGDTSGTTLPETLGSKIEYITNNDFSDGTAGWTPQNCTLNQPSANRLQLTSTASVPINQSADSSNFSVVAGVEYIVRFEITATSGSGAGIIFNPSDAVLEETGLHYWYPDRVGVHESKVTFATTGNAAIRLHSGTAVGASATFAPCSLRQANDGALIGFPTNSEWTLAQVEENLSAGELVNFTQGAEWSNDLPNTDGTMSGFTTPWTFITTSTDGEIVGTTLHASSSIQGSQKAFYEYNGNNVITSRKDLVFLETWTENLETHDVVCPYGNVQYAGTSFEGSTLQNNNVDQGYSAFGEWDVETRGYTAVWSTLTDAEKIRWAQNPQNNIFYDVLANTFYQEKYRIRVVEGLGDEWIHVRAKSVAGGGAATLRYDDSGSYGLGTSVNPKGQLIDIEDIGDFAQGMFSSSNDSQFNYNIQLGAFTGTGSGWERPSNKSADGISALPIALVQRLNQGAYSPEYNSQGTGMYWNVSGGSDSWYDRLGEEITSTAFCFDFADLPPNSVPSNEGKVMGGSYQRGHIDAYLGENGRSDQYEFYDAIYAGQVEDLRLNANKQDYARLLTQMERSAVSGKTRGKGKVPFLLQSLGITPSGKGQQATFIHINLPKGSLVDGETPELVESINTEYGYLVDASGNTWILSGRRTDATNDYAYISRLRYSDLQHTDIDITGTCWILESGWLPQEFDSLPWVDIIGDPERIAATFPDGVIGQWNGFRDASARQMLTKKAISAFKRIVTTDDGVSWLNVSSNLDTELNTVYSEPNDNAVTLQPYETLSDFTESDTNRAVVGDLGDVAYGMDSRVGRGNRLMPSLTDEIGKELSADNNGVPQYTTMVDYNLRDDGRLYNWSMQPQEHNAIKLRAPSGDNTEGFKALPHLVEKDGLLYVQWHATQLVYSDGEFSPWGDDAIITILDNEGVKVDINGKEVKVVTHTEMIPIGIADYTQLR